MLRIGQGFDLHQLVEGKPLILGGVTIPFEKGLDGHSDADVLIHAIIDALIGAIAGGDIGKLFPDTANEFKDIDSKILLKKTIEKVYDNGYKINNIDSTIIIERPKLRDYIDIMRETLAKITGIEVDQINIKAKTYEKIDAVGRGEAAIAQAIVLLIK